MRIDDRPADRQPSPSPTSAGSERSPDKSFEDQTLFRQIDPGPAIRTLTLTTSSFRSAEMRIGLPAVSTSPHSQSNSSALRNKIRIAPITSGNAGRLTFHFACIQQARAVRQRMLHHPPPPPSAQTPCGLPAYPAAPSPRPSVTSWFSRSLSSSITVSNSRCSSPVERMGPASSARAESTLPP